MNDETKKDFYGDHEELNHNNENVEHDKEKFTEPENQKSVNPHETNKQEDLMKSYDESHKMSNGDGESRSLMNQEEDLDPREQQSLIDETVPSQMAGEEYLEGSSQTTELTRESKYVKNDEGEKVNGAEYKPLENEEAYRFNTHRKPMDRSGDSDKNSYYYERVYQPENRKGRGFLGTLAMVLIGAVLGSALTMASGNYFFGENSLVNNNKTITGNAVAQQSKPAPLIVTAPPADTGVTPENKVASEVTPSVVGITTRTKVQQPLFFGQGGESGYVDGVGSGVIVSADGYIVTNAHVVDNGDATQIQVVFSDETTANGEVLWSDAALDLAIVKTDRTGLIPVEIGSSDAVKVGDKAIAIGNPLGMDLQSTLTSGYVSGLDRSITIQTGGTMSGLIQTDAAINEGNSGGALLNSAGQLIGINTAKAGGSVSGIGFAIPIDTARPIISKVMSEGTFKSVYIGITGLNVAIVKAQDQTLNYDGSHGVYVMEVMKGTAAAEAGLQSLDIITAIDDHVVNGMTDLKKALLNYQVGDEVEITYYRNNQKVTTSLVFAQDSSNIEEFQNQEP
ncbi:MAG: PDZ domain-containing protein [Clostridium sp.]|nr:PDZ domain-containing protein [Clostridium sp.]